MGWCLWTQAKYVNVANASDQTTERTKMPLDIGVDLRVTKSQRWDGSWHTLLQRCAFYYSVWWKYLLFYSFDPLLIHWLWTTKYIERQYRREKWTTRLQQYFSMRVYIVWPWLLLRTHDCMAYTVSEVQA